MKKQAIINFFSYFLVGLVYIVSWLPLWVLYSLSRILFFFLFHFPGYRKKIVYNNLANSFPYKSNKELLSIRRKFYHHLSNIIVETIKLLTCSQKELENFYQFTPEATNLINSFFNNNKSIIIVMGHYGNWELAGTSVKPAFGNTIIAAYKPIKNSVFDKLMIKLRTRFKVEVCPMKLLPKSMLALRKKVSATILIADQTPSKSNAHWVKFLNQDTPFFKGTAKLSRMFNYPVIYCSPRLKKRGLYEIHAWLITLSPKDHDEEALTNLHTKMLEKEIIRAPQYWLWTHKRWKHNKLPSNKSEQS